MDVVGLLPVPALGIIVLETATVSGLGNSSIPSSFEAGVCLGLALIRGAGNQGSLIFPSGGMMHTNSGKALLDGSRPTDME